MASSPTSRLRLNKQGTYDNPETWGIELNNGMIEMVDDAFGGFSATIEGNVTLTVENYTSDQARRMFMMLSGAGGFTITVPAVDKAYLVVNDCAADVTVTPLAGTGAVIRAGTAVWWYCDGEDGFVVDPTLDQIKAAAGDVDFGGNKALNLADPTDDQDAATKIYVDEATEDRSMGGFKLRDVADAVLSRDAAPLSQIISLITSASVNMPPQTGNGAKFLQTDGFTPSWQKVSLDQTSEIDGILAVGNGGSGLATIPANRLLLGNGASALASLPIGTSGQALFSNGPGVDPSWQTPASSGLVPIGAPVVVSSAVAAVDITLPAGYKNFKVIFEGLRPSADGDSLWLRVAQTSGAFLTSSYKYFSIYGTSSTTTVVGRNSNSASQIVIAENIYDLAPYGSTGVIEVAGLTPGRVWFATGSEDGSTNLNRTEGSGFLDGTTINFLRFLFSTGNIAAGRLQLYGYREGP